MKRLFVVLSLVSILFGFNQGAFGANGTGDDFAWTWRNPLPQGNQLRGVTYGNGTFVAVGDFGTILTSPDGVAWTQRSAGSTGTGAISNSLTAVAYGNGTFVAVGNSTPILTSSDGINWNRTDTSYNLAFITYGNGMFVAVGSYYNPMEMSYWPGILTSPDGVTWTERSQWTIRGALSSITYGNGLFVAVGSYHDPLSMSYVPTILTSPDGITWTQRSSGSTNQLNAVAYGANTFVVAGAISPAGGGVITPSILTSGDGIAWTERNPGWSNTFSSITYGNGMFVAFGSGAICTSADGVSWLQAPGTFTSLYSGGITYGNNTFVAVGGSLVLTSSNGLAWTERSSAVTHSNLNDVIYADGKFVAVGNYTVLTSVNGGTWSPPVTQYDLASVAYGNGMFVGVGSSYGQTGQIGSIVTSPDGVTWTQRTSGTTAQLKKIVYGNDMFVAVGYSSTYVPPNSPTYSTVILTSPDGVTWTQQDVGEMEAALSDIAYGNGTFVAVGPLYGSGSTAILTSADGVTWTPGGQGAINGTLSGIAYGNGTFVAIGSSFIQVPATTILTSPDGINWETRWSGPGPEVLLYGSSIPITYGGGRFVAVAGSRIVTSTDGVIWTEGSIPVNTGPMNAISGIAYGNGTFVIVGGAGVIFQSQQMEPGGLALSPSWNLVSLPLQPDNTSLSSVLSGIAGSYQVVWGYANQSWKFCNPANPQGSTLTTMEAGKGYWIKMTEGKTLSVAGSPPPSSIPLATGWNLVGYNGASCTAATGALSSLSGNLQVSWGYPAQAWKFYNPQNIPGSTLSEMCPGYGYWIKVNQAGTWGGW